MGLIEPAPHLDAAVRAATDIHRRCLWLLAQPDVPVEALARLIDALQESFVAAATALGTLRSAATDAEIQRRLEALVLNPPADFAAAFDAARAAGQAAIAAYAEIHAAQGGRTVALDLETGQHRYLTLSAAELAPLLARVATLRDALAPVARA